MQLTMDQFSNLNEIQDVFHSSVNNIKSELDEHLDSINQNSLEIQSNYDYLDEINTKIDKLHSRIDELAGRLLDVGTSRPETIELTAKEKEAFLVLYTAQEPLSYEEIASRSALPMFLVEDLITSLKIKGISIIKKNFAGKILMILDEDFKKKQAKYNIVNINQNILTNF